MAIVNDKKKFIFFHLYKCGGTSLRTLLNKKFKENQEVLSGHCLPRDLKYHYYFRGKEYEDKFDEMFKFTIIRNPFDFLLSTYHYARAYTHHFWHNDVINMEFNDFPKFYVDKINTSKQIDETSYGSNKITTPYEFIRDYDGKVIVDFVAKLENIEKDMDFILKKLRIKSIDFPLVNVNINNDKPYQLVYDKPTRDFVEKHFAKDFEYFEYQWIDL